MKVINSKDYTFIKKEGNWFVFKSKPKINFDEELVYVKRARYVREDGSSIFYETKPIKYGN